MCEPRSWTNLHSTNLVNDSLVLVARRSDGEMFYIQFKYAPTDIIMTHANFRAALKMLEEYRICQCRTHHLCERHKNKGEINAN